MAGATIQQVADYCRGGYVIIEDAVPPALLASAQLAYENTIEKAIELGHDGAAGFEQRSPTTGGYRFQDPHNPAILHEPLVQALSAPKLMAFVEELCGPSYCMHGIAAFSMGEAFDYRGQWHRDSYAAWGKDSEKELEVREIPTSGSAVASQILVALHDDACFTMVPASQDRANTAVEEELLDSAESNAGSAPASRPGYAPTATTFPGQLTLRLKAGSAVPFDSRAIHRGMKVPGLQRKSLFVVYGPAENVASCVICKWAKEPEYAAPEYLERLPASFRSAVERTIAAVKDGGMWTGARL